MKYQLIDMTDESILAKGNCERIGIDGHFKHTTGDGRSCEYDVEMTNHTEAFIQIKNALIDEKVGVIKELSEVSAIGHRIVQGGSIFKESVLVTEKETLHFLWSFHIGSSICIHRRTTLYWTLLQVWEQQ